MIEVMKGNSRLAGEIDQRQDEKYQRGNKQNHNAILVRYLLFRWKIGPGAYVLLFTPCGFGSRTHGEQRLRNRIIRKII